VSSLMLHTGCRLGSDAPLPAIPAPPPSVRWHPVIARKLEWHYTPKHGSWLNVAEVELAALAKQCLGRRLGTRAELERQVAAWEGERNRRFVDTQWRFTTAEARVKLCRLYPSIQE